MKILFMMLISLPLSAATIGQYISSPDGSSVQAFTLSAKKATYDKKSNFFDKEKDLSLGKFELNATETTSKEEKVIAAALAKIKEVDTFMKKRNSSFNDLSGKKPHESFLFIDDYRITQGSDLYPELKAAFDSLSSKKWKQVSGVQLQQDLKSYIEFKNGKEVSKHPFNMLFNCKSGDVPTVCRFKDLGVIFVQ